MWGAVQPWIGHCEILAKEHLNSYDPPWLHHSCEMWYQTSESLRLVISLTLWMEEILHQLATVSKYETLQIMGLQQDNSSTNWYKTSSIHSISLLGLWMFVLRHLYIY